MFLPTLVMTLVLGSTPSTLTVTVDGLQREALVYVPDHASGPVPVVFGFHGHGGSMRSAARSFRFQELWPEAMVVYMQGVPTPGRLTDPEGKRSGWQHKVGDHGDRDLKFFDVLLGELKSKYSINERQLFAAGHSNGGGFTYLLWEAKPEVFAGFAPSAAVARRALTLKPKPAMHLAGRNDPLVKFAAQELSMRGVRRALNVKPEVKMWKEKWQRYEAASGEPWIEVLHEGDHKYPVFGGEVSVQFFQEVAATQGQSPSQQTEQSTKDVSFLPWKLEELYREPQQYPSEVCLEPGVKTLFYEGLPYKGKPTRVFAYYGVPSPPSDEPNKKWPAMVLIHGGGGTAFARWVKVWNERGYAAIAMDLCGCIPEGTYGNWSRHDQGGPAGWDASFSQLQDPIGDQWTYHAVGAAILGHSLIRSFPEIDADRIGVTGISWGGYLTSIVAGVDSRFRFAVPVYGCGFLGDNSAWLPQFEKLGPEQARTWLNQWDPSQYLPRASMPILWVNGTNDFAYPMDSWQKSYRLPSSPRTLCLRIRMPHGHGPAGENPEEIHIFANQILQQGKPLPKIRSAQLDGDTLQAIYESDVPLEKAELAYTVDSGKWQDRQWLSAEATIDPEKKTVSVQVPSEATVFYINLFDHRQCVVSSEHIERNNGK